MKSLFFYFSLVVLMLITAGYATSDLTDDLVVHFTFDTVTGKRILDESGNNLDAKVVANTGFIKGKYGNAIHVTANTEDCVNVPISKKLKISGEITMMAWVYQEKWLGASVQWFDKGTFTPMLHQAYGMGVFDKKDVAAVGMLKRGSAIGIILGGENQHKILIPNEMKDRTWHHVVGTYDGKNAIIYLDGEAINEGDLELDFRGTNDQDLRIGCVRGKPHYTFKEGAIDEVAIWSRALSEDEIRSAMRGPLLAVSPKDKVATTWGNIKRTAFQP